LSSRSLDELAVQFRDDLNKLFSDCFGESPFEIELSATNTGRVTISTSRNADKLFVISSSRKILASFLFGLELDRENKYLSVAKSEFHVFFGAAKRTEPIFRYEYVKAMHTAKVPNSHLHIHAQRGEFTHAQQNWDLFKDSLVPMSAAHFPVGGGFMRPSLEEVLLFCDREFHLDFSKSTVKKLIDSMESYRETQALAIAREYRSVLEAHGWSKSD